ncbi:MAG: VOC family protein [Gammaproteobacteria bacterium]|nr:VOC family protein [Gammaproteobacteria bacterium]
MIRYKRLGYLALNVTDLDRSTQFYRETVGLQQVGGDGVSVRYLRCSDKHHDIALYVGKPGLKRVGLELESAAQVEPLRQVLREAGRDVVNISAVDRTAMHTGPGVRTWEPVSGCTFDFYAGMEGADAVPFEPTVAKIQRLGHLVLRSADQPATVRYFTEVLNFKVSDSIDGAVTFMRCFPNPFHHSLGISNGKGRNGLHHLNFMVSDADDIGTSMWRLKKLDVPIVNGPGRHLPSGSMFLYFLDPDGLTVEYSFGMEEFAEEGAREPRTLPPVSKSFDLWEGPVDPRKAAVGEIERSQPAAQTV